MSEPTSLHQRPVSELLDFIKTELDTGRMTALVVGAISQDKDVFRETWLSPTGTAAYTLIGALETEKADLHKRFFDDE